MIDEHRRDQKLKTSFAILVVSDSRTKETDQSGKIAMEIVESEGHVVEAYDIVKNDEGEVRTTIIHYINDSSIRVVLTSGGTGVGRKDITTDTVESLLDKKLDGFGEYFRRLSHEEIGLAGIFSRALAGLAGNKAIFCLPGSKNAMSTALKKIILPSIGHLLWEVDR